MLLAGRLTHEQIDERTEIATPNRTMLYDQSRANERKSLAPENERLCQKVAEMSQSVRLALRLDFEPSPVPVTRLLVPLNHSYGLVCLR